MHREDSSSGEERFTGGSETDPENHIIRQFAEVGIHSSKVKQ
jgi:hypothetical protein